MTDCVNWNGYRDRDGYGRKLVPAGWKGRKYKGPEGAHVLAFYEAFGITPVFDGIICHTCDNRACVNPDHLYLGTPKTNAEDAKNRGRLKSFVGSSNGRSRLNEQDVEQIRLLRKEGLKLQEISNLFDVSLQQISKICLNKRWAHCG